VPNPARVSFRSYLEKSFETMRVQSPGHLEAFRSSFGGLCVRIRVGDEALRVEPTGGTAWTKDDGDAHVTVAIGSDTLARILEGHATIEQCVWDGTLSIRGRIDDVLRFHDALRLWINGALRCYDFPRLYEGYLGGTDGGR